MGESADIVGTLISVHQKQLALYNKEVTRAVKWMRLVPSLPCNEMAQAAEHYLDALEAVLTSRYKAAELEAERARKHIALATHDCIATLIRFHLDFITHLVADLKTEGTAPDIFADVLREHGRIATQNKLRPPSKQQKTLTATQDDIETTLNIINKKNHAVRNVEAIYDNTLKKLCAAKSFKARLKAYQESLRLSSPEPDKSHPST